MFNNSLSPKLGKALKIHKKHETISWVRHYRHSSCRRELQSSSGTLPKRSRTGTGAEAPKKGAEIGFGGCGGDVCIYNIHICAYIYMCIYIYTHVYIYMCMYIYIFLNVVICMSLNQKDVDYV